jgi:hypothetical protein
MAFTDALRSIYAFFDVKFDDRELKRGDKAVEGTISSLKELGGLVGAGFAVAGLSQFVQDAVRAGSEIRRVAAQTGASIEQVSDLGVIFGSVGLEMDDVGDLMTVLQERAVDAADGTQGMIDMFRSLNVEFKDSQGNLKTGSQLFDEVADALAGMSSDTERAGRALIMFGDPGRKLLPILNGGTDAIRKYREEIQKLGGGDSPEFVKATEKTSKSIRNFGIVLRGLRSRIAVTILPIVDKFLGVVKDLGVAFLEFTKGSYMLEAALLVLSPIFTALAVKAAIIFGPLLVKVTAVIAFFTMLALIVEDLIVTFKGGRSVLRGFLEEMLGVRRTEVIINDLKLAWEGVKAAIEFTGDAIKGFLRPFGLLGDATERFFGRRERAARAVEGEEDLMRDFRRQEGDRQFGRRLRGARAIAGEEQIEQAQSVPEGVRAGQALRLTLDPTAAGDFARNQEEERLERTRGIDVEEERAWLRQRDEASAWLRERRTEDSVARRRQADEDRVASAIETRDRTTYSGQMRTLRARESLSRRHELRDRAAHAGELESLTARESLARRERLRSLAAGMDEPQPMTSVRDEPELLPFDVDLVGESGVTEQPMTVMPGAEPDRGGEAVAAAVMQPLESRIVVDRGDDMGMSIPVGHRRTVVNVGETTIDMTINAQGADADEVARRVRREIEASTERERRRTIAALDGVGVGE